MTRSTSAAIIFSVATLGFTASLWAAILNPRLAEIDSYIALVLGLLWVVAFGVFCYDTSCGR